MRLPIAVVLLSLASPVLSAELGVSFGDGAPKDRFTLTTGGGSDCAATDVVIDPGTAPAGKRRALMTRVSLPPCTS